MSDFNEFLESSHKKLIIFFYLLLTFLGGIYTLASILHVPSQSARAVIFGLSLPRLLLFICALGITTLAGLVLIKYTTDKTWSCSFLENLISKISNPRLFGTILILSITCIVWGSNILVQIHEITEPVALAYYLRLQPIFTWALIMAGQTIICIYLLHYGFSRDILKRWGRRFYLYLLILGLVLILSIWIFGTRYGLDPIDEGIGWHPLGTPLLFSQFLVAWAITMGFLFLWVRLRSKSTHNQSKTNLKVDTIISLTLWLFAFTLWMMQPLKANWFASEPRPPNYQFYPSSDASVYDVTAINLSLGAGFKTRGSPFTLRPLFSAFLAGLHQIAGPGYENIIWLQVAFLALIPVFLYLLTRQIHHRITGLLVALLFIFREMNAIRLGDSISDAHAKLLMPFLPTALGIIIFLWLFTRWLQNPRGNLWIALASGGVAGLLMLVRPEFVFLLPFITLLALLQLRKTVHHWFQGMVMLAAGLTLALAPWLWRNYQLTGTIYIDSPHYRLDLLYKRYRDVPIGFVFPETIQTMPEISTPESLVVPTESVVQTPIVSDAPEQPYDNLTPTIELQYQEKPSASSTSEVEVIQTSPGEDIIQQSTKGFAAEVINFIQNNPGTTTTFIMNHLMNSVVQSVLALPSTYPMTQSAVSYLGHNSLQAFWMDCCSLVDYERKIPFWPKWDGQLPGKSIIPLTTTLFLISIGIGVSWRKERYIGLIPLLCAFSYYFINALVRNSGGRYIIPLNWVAFLYFSIGLVQISLYIVSFFQNKVQRIESPLLYRIENHHRNIYSQKKRIVIIAIIIFLIAILLPLLEVIIPQKYDQASLNRKQETVFSNNNPNLSSTELNFLEEFLKNQGLMVQGQALYPRFHKPYQMGSVWRIYYDRPYSHVDFYLSSPGDRGVVLPLVDSPLIFPHASEILVFGCSQEEDIQALAVVIFTADGTIKDILWRSPFPEYPICPLPEVN